MRPGTVLAASLVWMALAAHAMQPQGAWPSVEWERKGSASRALQSLSAFRSEYKCATCRGAGTVTIRVKKGERRVNGVLHPIMVNREVACESCDGTCYQSTERLTRSAERMLRDVLAVPADDAKMEAVRKVLKDVAIDMATVRPDQLAKALNDAAATKLTDTTVDKGATIFVSGTLASDQVIDGVGRVQTVDFPDKRMTIFLRDAWVVDATAGETVLVGAKLAGRIEGETGLVPVLQGGFVVGPDERRK